MPYFNSLWSTPFIPCCNLPFLAFLFDWRKRRPNSLPLYWTENHKHIFVNPAWCCRSDRIHRLPGGILLFIYSFIFFKVISLFERSWRNELMRPSSSLEAGRPPWAGQLSPGLVHTNQTVPTHRGQTHRKKGFDSPLPTSYRLFFFFFFGIFHWLPDENSLLFFSSLFLFNFVWISFLMVGFVIPLILSSSILIFCYTTPGHSRHQLDTKKKQWRTMGF